MEYEYLRSHWAELGMSMTPEVFGHKDWTAVRAQIIEAMRQSDDEGDDDMEIEADALPVQVANKGPEYKERDLPWLDPDLVYEKKVTVQGQQDVVGRNRQLKVSETFITFLQERSKGSDGVVIDLEEFNCDTCGQATERVPFLSFDSLPKTRRTGMADPKQIAAVIHCYKCAKAQKELSWERVPPTSFSDRMSLKASPTSSGKPPEIYDASMETYCGLCYHKAAEMNDEEINDGEELKTA